MLDAAAAGDVAERDRVILVHLAQMEAQLEQTQASVASLRTLLEGSQPGLGVEFRSVARDACLAIADDVAWDDVESWLTDAFAVLHATLDHGDAVRDGPDGALYAPEFFEAHAGEVVAFLPIAREPAALTGPS